MQLSLRHRSAFALASLSLAIAGSPAGAQQSLLGPGAAFISLGGARVSTEALDERLAANSYPTFGTKAGGAGIGGYRIVRGNLLIGAEITGLDLGQKPHNGSQVWLGGGHGTLGIGFVKDLTPRVRVYPRLGLGGGGLTLLIQTEDTTTFDAVLANPAPTANRDRHMSRDGGVIDLGGGLEFQPRGGGPLIGVRLGYILASFGSTSNWQLLDGTATGGPDASISGPYLRLVLGGAWRR